MKMTTFRVSTADYNAGSDLYAAVVQAGLGLAPLHPMLTDPALAHLIFEIHA